MVSRELDLWFLRSIGNLAQYLVAIWSEGLSHIRNFFLNNFNEKRTYFLEESIWHVVVPSRDENTVLWLQDEVIRYIIYNDGLVDVTTQKTQVLHQKGSILRGVLTIQAILDILVDINLVDDLIRIILKSGCEYDDFVEFGHELDKIDASRSNQEVTITSILNIMNQSLIQIKD